MLNILKYALVIVFLVSLGHSALAQETDSICKKDEAKDHQVMSPMSVQSPQMVNVHLEKTFIDGVKIVNISKTHFISLENILTKYSGFRLSKCNERDVFLSKKIDDLSPISKTAGIIGLKDGNVLTLYNGNPKENKIIQTFFQIDINALEADAAKKLNQGIRITNKNQYEMLLHSLSKIAINHVSQAQRNS